MFEKTFFKIFEKKISYFQTKKHKNENPKRFKISILFGFPIDALGVLGGRPLIRYQMGHNFENLAKSFA